MSQNNEIFISVDCEADGPIPGPYSMLSFAAVAINKEGTQLGTFEVNLTELEGASQDPDTMEFWAKNPEAWEACRQNLQHPSIAMKDFRQWLERFHKPIMIEYPGGFDLMFLHWYMMKFTGNNPMSFTSIGMRAYAMGALACDFRDTYKKSLPRAWMSKKRHSHIALDDALGQADLFINMSKANRARKLRIQQAFRDIYDMTLGSSDETMVKINEITRWFIN